MGLNTGGHVEEESVVHRLQLGAAPFFVELDLVALAKALGGVAVDGALQVPLEFLLCLEPRGVKRAGIADLAHLFVGSAPTVMSPVLGVQALVVALASLARVVALEEICALAILIQVEALAIDVADGVGPSVVLELVDCLDSWL
jgi:hypothetical protein